MNRFAIVGALVLLVLIPTLICFGIISMMTPLASGDRASAEDILEAQGTIHSFLDDLRGGNLDGAYGRTSGNFKGRQSKEQFQAWAEKYPQLMEMNEESMNEKSGAKSTAIAYDIVLAAKGKSRFKLNMALIKEGDGWKVDSVSAQ
jgi:phage tail tape-measure protein